HTTLTLIYPLPPLDAAPMLREGVQCRNLRVQLELDAPASLGARLGDFRHRCGVVVGPLGGVDERHAVRPHLRVAAHVSERDTPVLPEHAIHGDAGALLGGTPELSDS